MKSPDSNRHVFPYYLGIVVLLLLMIGTGAVLLRALPGQQLEAERRLAYAATGTYVAVLPSSALSTPQVSATSSQVPLPTSHDMAILPTPYLEETLPAGIPTRTPLLQEQASYELVNFLVLGSDQRSETRAYRTDVIVIASVNWTSRTVNLLSVPRDLYVYVPGWGMDRINTAELHQTQTHESHHRLGLLAETIEYNFGIRIDHIARIDFQGFEQIIDLIGGVTVPVDCPVSGYQLAADGSRWLPFVLEPGLYDMNGEMALWYVRQRIDSSDFDRNRRQQIVLRALWRTAKSTDLVGQLPSFWQVFSQMVQTDLTLEQAVQYAPLLLELESEGVESHFVGLDEVNLWRTPSGANVLVIDPEPFARTLHRFLTPPIENRLHGEQAMVEVINASSLTNAEQLAAAQLQWAGLAARPIGDAGTILERTTVYDYSGAVKGSSLGAITSALALNPAAVSVVEPATNSIDFTVIIGEDYESCLTDAWRAFAQPE